MAIRKEDWVNIRQEIDAALKERLNPHGWRKAFHVLSEWAPLGGIFTVVVALIAIIAGLGISVANRREADGKFEGSMETRLTAIEKRLDVIEHSFATSLLKNQASLPQAEFQRQLRDLKSAVTIARETKSA